MKKIIVTGLCAIMLGIVCGGTSVFAHDGDHCVAYDIYNINGNYLCEKSDVVVDDIYITKDFEMYKITEVDTQNNTAVAEFVKYLNKPNVYVDPLKSISSGYYPGAKIGMYLTHNAESYVPSDGYDSIYGKGGVHDVAIALGQEFEKLGVNVTLDETLHLPHDTSAYTRSGVTAQSILNTADPDALFDIHRDAISKSYYAVTNGGVDYSKVRIVIGQSNPNSEQNLEFALYLLSVAEQSYPWLFLDIYMGSGHYNQELTNKGLLFEMGTYLIEKEAVINTTPILAEVVCTSLYGTTIDTETGDIVVGDSVVEQPTLNEYFDDIAIQTKSESVAIIVTVSILGVAGLGIASYYTYVKIQEQNKTKKSKK